MPHHLAELNIGRLNAELDDPAMAEFTEALGPINELAESSPGFVWRLTDESGASSSYVEVYDDPLLVVNFSVWETAEALRDFVFKTAHVEYLRRRREWFEALEEIITVCWWIPVGHTPTIPEALERLDLLRTEGPTAQAFPLSAIQPQPVET